MQPNTHLYLGNYSYDLLEQETLLPVNKKAFLFGCVEPDLPGISIKQPRHYMKNSWGFIQEVLGRINEAVWQEGIGNHKLSFWLGVVHHYICDYFCLPHNERVYYKPLQRHLNYEHRLHHCCYGFDAHNRQKVLEIAHQKPLLYLPGEKDLGNYVLSIHGDYQEIRKGNMDDLNFAMMALDGLLLNLAQSIEDKGNIWRPAWAVA